MGAGISTSPVQSVKEHKKITDEIDDSYMETVRASAMLQAYLVSGGGGNKREQFISFYTPFCALFSHTRHMKGIDSTDASPNEEVSVIIEIEKWITDCRDKRNKKVPNTIIERGLVLFSKYQKKLLKSGAITITR